MKPLVAFAAIICSVISVPAAETNVVQEIFDTTNIAIIAKPDSVRAWRTVGSLSDSGRFEEYYQKSGEGVAVSSVRASELSKILLRDDSYPPRALVSKMCLARPGVVVTFSKGNQSVNVFFCFECRLLLVNVDVTVPHWNPPDYGADLCLSAGKLTQIMKEIFPKDPQIQKLGSDN